MVSGGAFPASQSNEISNGNFLFVPPAIENIHPFAAHRAGFFPREGCLFRTATFSSFASISVSNACNRDVSDAPRSQSFSEPINRNVGSSDSSSASFTSSYPARRLYTNCRSRSCVLKPEATDSSNENEIAPQADRCFPLAQIRHNLHLPSEAPSK